MDSSVHRNVLEAGTANIASHMPLAAGFLTFVGIECFVDQLVAPIKPIIGQYFAKYLLVCSGSIVTNYLDIYVAYILSYKTNIENLLKQVKKLKATRGMVLQAVEDAKRRGEVVIRAEVEKWLSSADRLTDEATKFFEFKGDANNGWSRWFYDMLMSRYQMSKNAKKMIEHLIQLQADDGTFGSHYDIKIDN